MKARSIDYVAVEVVEQAIGELVKNHTKYITIDALCLYLLEDGAGLSYRTRLGLRLNQLGCVWSTVKVSGIPTKIWQIDRSGADFCPREAREDVLRTRSPLTRLPSPLPADPCKTRG